MPWITGKKIKLLGHEFKRGEPVPQAVVDQIPPGRFGSLQRLGMVQEVTPGQAETLTVSTTTTLVESEEGEHCPQCGQGPFRRVAQHVAQMHQGDSA